MNTVTFSARQAATLLGRSYSWIDQRLRAGDFTYTDGGVIEPIRTRGGYRRFDTEILKAICFAAYRRRWFRYGHVQEVLSKLAIAQARAKTDFLQEDRDIRRGSRYA